MSRSTIVKCDTCGKPITGKEDRWAILAEIEDTSVLEFRFFPALGTDSDKHGENFSDFFDACSTECLICKVREFAAICRKGRDSNGR